MKSQKEFSRNSAFIPFSMVNLRLLVLNVDCAPMSFLWNQI